MAIWFNAACALLGAQWAYRSFLIVPEIFYLLPGSPPRPPSLHPCVQCEITKLSPIPFDTTKRYLPLEFCGYGPANFSWITYGCDGRIADEENFFAGLGFEEGGHIPSARQVAQRYDGLMRIWNRSESVEKSRKQERITGTGLSDDQLIAIAMRLDRMVKQLDAYRERAKASQAGIRIPARPRNATLVSQDDPGILGGRQDLIDQMRAPFPPSEMERKRKEWYDRVMRKREPTGPLSKLQKRRARRSTYGWDEYGWSRWMDAWERWLFDKKSWKKLRSDVSTTSWWKDAAYTATPIAFWDRTFRHVTTRSFWSSLLLPQRAMLWWTSDDWLRFTENAWELLWWKPPGWGEMLQESIWFLWDTESWGLIWEGLLGNDHI